MDVGRTSSMQSLEMDKAKVDANFQRLVNSDSALRRYLEKAKQFVNTTKVDKAGAWKTAVRFSIALILH